METMQKIREPLSGYQHGKGKLAEVFHARIRDDISGLRVLSGLLENSAKLENARITYEKPRTDGGGLVGVTLTHFNPASDIIFLGILAVNLAFHIISNDAFAARDLMVKTLFGTRATFNRQSESLIISEEWTDAVEFVQPFYFAVDELMPFPERAHYFQD
jgi:hypothetical protein